MPRTLEEADDDGDRKLISLIAEGGWNVIYVPEDEHGPGFAFTIGLFTNFGHPELAMVGLRRELMHSVLNHLGDDIRKGARLMHGSRADDVLEGVTCAFVAADRVHYPEWFGYARWWYRGDEFPVLQVVWPDKENRLPWDPGVNPVLARQEPVLGPVPILADA